MNNMAKFIINGLIKFLVCFLQFKSLYSETVLGEKTDEFDFDGLPGAQHEFNMDILPGSEQCFYQNVREGADLYVSFQVLRGGDENVDVFLKDPSSVEIDSILNKPNGLFEREAVEAGDYSICIINRSSGFYSKLVYVYMVTYVKSDWTKYLNELNDVHLTVSNFTASINSVQSSISEVLKYQARTRMHLMKDGYLIDGKYSYVQYWAILYSAIFIVMSVFQVYFVRRLFGYINITQTEKPGV